MEEVEAMSGTRWEVIPSAGRQAWTVLDGAFDVIAIAAQTWWRSAPMSSFRDTHAVTGKKYTYWEDGGAVTQEGADMEYASVFLLLAFDAPEEHYHWWELGKDVFWTEAAAMAARESAKE